MHDRAGGAGRTLTALAALALTAGLAACGGPSQPATTPTNAPAASAAPPAVATPPVAQGPDPALDRRPDKVKLADFLSRIESQQTSLAAADDNFIRGVRASLGAGEQGTRIVMGGYRSELDRESASLPLPPRLASCMGKAGAASDKALADASAMLTDRRDKLAAVAPADRPMALADFGPLATDFAASAAGDEVKAQIAAARSLAAAACLPPRKPRPLRTWTERRADSPTDLPDRFHRAF